MRTDHADQGPSSGTEAAPFTVAAPAVELPKGGGAIRGMGEKFAANPVTGTGAMTVPIPLSRGRGGFGPSLSLSYDSGAGNGSFGFGWSLDLPQVTRKTDRGLPQYDDAAESDVYLLSGVEDLVPVLDGNGSRSETRAAGYVIHRYRPRIEGLFARIERWTRISDGDAHWRSYSRDNVLTVYGADARSRIADPEDAGRVFSWLICESRDDKGNAIHYDYKPEDGAGVELRAAHQRNRGPGDDRRRQANRYLKRIRYGNRRPLLDPDGNRPTFLDEPRPAETGWLFEAVLDYGEHDLVAPQPAEEAAWSCRVDAFSRYRAGFEIRTSRRCRRVLMFHHFADEPGVGENCLVQSIDLGYSDEMSEPDPRYPIHSFLRSVTQYGYRRQGSGYLRRGLPPVEFEYSVPTVRGAVEDVDPTSVENAPMGLDGTAYRFADLHGEGCPGLLTEQAGSWYYKRNLGPLTDRLVRFAAVERVGTRPNVSLAAGAQLMDVRGDGRLDVVLLGGPAPGVHEHDTAESWSPFRTFAGQLNRDIRDPNLRFVDLDGDGHADVLITEDDALVWHPSLAEDGFGPARKVAQARDEEAGPRLLFADPAQSVHLADMSGDGLTDLVRVRNGEICYWPSLGYGRFGAKISMDHAPVFDQPDAFDQRRLRLADIDGSGTTDVLYLSGDGVTLYFNQAGNGWADGQRIAALPAVDDLAAIQLADLMGNGTACLVWSSPLPGDAMRPMRYVDLMGGQKPHLLVRAVNNLGVETVVHYAPSTRFYLADKLAGTPWITRLPFPVHVVDRVDTVDRITGSRFGTRFAYHHGYFDGDEREFRGFGLVEQWDTEEYAALRASSPFAQATTVDAASHVPPVLTRTWFHTGACTDREGVSRQHSAGYYREPGLTEAEAQALLLDDTVLPAGLSPDEEREACRALKGAMLRRETYALDGSDREAHPYSVMEQNRGIRLLQPQAGNRHAVVLTHAREAITYQYDRNPADPRVAQVLTLDVDEHGNVLRSATVAYGRRRPDARLSSQDQARQGERHVTCTENAFTNPVDLATAYRTPLPCESRGYELAGLEDRAEPRLTFDRVRTAAMAATPIPCEEGFTAGRLQKRLIEHVRTVYRPDDLGAGQADPLALLQLGELESLALAGEGYRLAMTPGLVAQRFGGKVTDEMLREQGRYVNSAGDDNWWLCAGRVFLSPGTADDGGAELAYARQHFFQPHRVRDPFHRAGFDTQSVVTYDAYDLAIRETRDALGNATRAVQDYRVVKPCQVSDANGNRTQVAFDALGMVVGTAVMGKEAESRGDSLAGFETDLDEAAVVAELADPGSLLGHASTRLVYDPFAYQRSSQHASPQPAVVHTLARETHDSDLAAGAESRIQHSLVYSDGLGREVQRKLRAEPGPLGPGGADVEPRWVGTGWTVFDNKGNPVRRYEPFFTATHRFESHRTEGVSATSCYDPVGRVVAVLHPDHTWEKTVFDPWRQEIWDGNDTVLIADAGADPDVGGHFERLAESDYRPSWHDQRAGGGMGAWEQAAAANAAVHAATPTVAHLDSLGRTMLTVAHNRLRHTDSPPEAPPEETFLATRVLYDIEGNQRELVDAEDRVVIRYDPDMLGRRLHSHSMDTGHRWSLSDVAGRPLYGWDDRDHRLRTSYDVLGRPVATYLRAGDAPELLVGRAVFGEVRPDPEAANLRGRRYQTFDGAGVVTVAAYDFKGNALSESRRLAADYKETPDWSRQVPLEPEALSTGATFDALNRPITQTTPDGTTIRRTYNEANLVETIEANLRGDTDGGQPVWKPFVSDIDYNAKGQRERIEYGNGSATSYDYDARTFRLNRMRTRVGDQRLQDLSYTYDPAGNVTHIEDAAQESAFFRNAHVRPSSDYLYDATYQLIEATGREQPDQLDGCAMARYLERYRYDAAGNLREVRHVGSDPAHPGWTRAYSYAEPSRIEPDQTSNRLSATRVGTGPVERYSYDPHGSVTSMPQLSLMRWDFRDRLSASARQVVNGGDPETTYYVYDAGGQRVRKVTELAAAAGEPPIRKGERVYVGAFEIHRQYEVTGVVRHELETAHVMDGQRRIALVETVTQGEEDGQEARLRVQIADHLDSAVLELDGEARILSYEEYLPYGSTSYQAKDPNIRAAAKRYRHTGVERDEETSFSYHGARYYVPCLGRWLSADPVQLDSRLNLYAYCENNPVGHVDTGGAAPSPALTPPTASERLLFGLVATKGYFDAMMSMNFQMVQLAVDPRAQWSAIGSVARQGAIDLVYMGPLYALNRYNPVAHLAEAAENAQNAYLSNEPYEMGGDLFRGAVAGASLIAPMAAPEAGGLSGMSGGAAPMVSVGGDLSLVAVPELGAVALPGLGPEAALPAIAVLASRKRPGGGSGNPFAAPGSGSGGTGTPTGGGAGSGQPGGWRAGLASLVGNATAFNKAVEQAMLEMGIPPANIGINCIPGAAGTAFDPGDPGIAGNVLGRGISIGTGITGPFTQPWAEWDAAPIDVRVEATTVHEWLEMNSTSPLDLRHNEAVRAGQIGQYGGLTVSPAAQDLLRTMPLKPP
jgi:RHS repeat-associated protein